MNIVQENAEVTSLQEQCIHIQTPNTSHHLVPLFSF
jgi:hypothetical protein